MEKRSSSPGTDKRRTVGVLAGWQFYRPTIPFIYGVPIIRGIEKAACEYGCNLLFACGMCAK
jgi:hypothetical protein